jgi:hypothetical protein
MTQPFTLQDLSSFFLTPSLLSHMKYLQRNLTRPFDLPKVLMTIWQICYNPQQSCQGKCE